jgi:hypothetical protein
MKPVPTKVMGNKYYCSCKLQLCSKYKWKSYNFINNSLSVPNLVSGSYSICITIPGKYFEQCYTVNVAKEKLLLEKLCAVSNKVSIEIVEGTTSHQIS